LLKQPNARWRAASASLFAALGDETRLGLVSALSTAGSLSIARLTAGTRISRQAVTKHLRVMEKAGLVSAARHGKEQRWKFVPAGLEEVRRSLDVISQQWGAALGRLKSFVER
jgi:DNA-binding transcriptional ArsR family regulator